MDKVRLDALAAALQAKGATRPCARCGHTQFSILHETLLTVQPLSGTFVVGQGGVPAVVVACNNCGNLLHHALGALGMIPAGLQHQGGGR